MLKESYAGCNVRIKRNSNLERLLLNQRSVKIAARRQTFSLDSRTPHTSSNGNALFKKICSKLFMRRQSVGIQTQSVSNENNVLANLTANRSMGESNARVQLNNDFGAGANQSNISTRSLINSTSNAGYVATIDDVNKENNSTELFPFLPKIVPSTYNNSLHTLSPILDMIVPNSSNLSAPLKPLIGYSTALLDQSIPSNVIDLPAPLIPLNNSHRNNIDIASVQQRPTTSNRSIPSLLPMCDVKTKRVENYGKAKKSSFTAQLIIDSLDKFDQSQEDSIIANTSFSFLSNASTVGSEQISFNEDFNDSDEFFGRLTYDGDSE